MLAVKFIYGKLTSVVDGIVSLLTWKSVWRSLFYDIDYIDEFLGF